MRLFTVSLYFLSSLSKSYMKFINFFLKIGCENTYLHENRYYYSIFKHPSMKFFISFEIYIFLGNSNDPFSISFANKTYVGP